MSLFEGMTHGQRAIIIVKLIQTAIMLATMVGMIVFAIKMHRLGSGH